MRTSERTPAARDASAARGAGAGRRHLGEIMTRAPWDDTATVAVTDPWRLGVARAATDRVLAAVDGTCGTDLARVNAGAGRAVPVGATFLAVLRAALDAAESTGGLVDP